MKKTFLIAAVVILLVPVLLSAQEMGNADHRLFGVQVGFVAGYDLDTDDVVVGRDYGMNFTLSESLQIGFRSISGLLAADAILVDFAYYLNPNIAFDLMVGDNGGDFTAGMEAAYLLFRSPPDEVFSSALKLKAGYLFDVNGIDLGVMNFGLIGTLGY